MAQIKELIQGNIGRIWELRVAGTNAVLNVSVAVTPRKKQGDEWVDDETVWTEVTVWGDTARNIVNSDIKPGTPVIIYGTRKARLAPAYQAKNGTEVPERVEQSVTADIFAVELTRWHVITKIDKANKSNVGGAPANTAAANTAPANPAAFAPTENLFGDGSTPSAEDQTKNIFGDF